MEIEINEQAAEPVYLQIAEQIQRAVQDGALSSGTPLPSIRQLARDLALNPNTVAKAYRMLEQGGIIVTVGRRGTFVREGARDHGMEQARLELKRRLHEAMSRAFSAGVSHGDVKHLFNQVFSSF